MFTYTLHGCSLHVSYISNDRYVVCFNLQNIFSYVFIDFVESILRRRESEYEYCYDLDGGGGGKGLSILTKNVMRRYIFIFQKLFKINK
jgi:hypothetical protein